MNKLIEEYREKLGNYMHWQERDEVSPILTDFRKAVFAEAREKVLALRASDWVPLSISWDDINAAFDELMEE